MSELTTEEQKNVRAAMRFLRGRFGSWERVAEALRSRLNTVSGVVHQGRAVSAGLAIRTARLAGVAIDDVLSGKYPPAGACPHCGHIPLVPVTTEAAR